MRDRAEVLVRPIAPTDKELIEHARDRLSDRSRYRRFLSLGNLLAERARELGIRRFTALLLAGNEQMLDVPASLGQALVPSRDTGTVEVEVELPQEGIGEHMAGALAA